MTKANEKTALVTGSTDGVGRVVAKRLAEQGWRVLVHGRDHERGGAVVAEIEAAGGVAEFLPADLSSLTEVRGFAGAIHDKAARLDLLINNAGLGTGGGLGRRQISVDGYELRFAVNYLAGFLLTHLLLPVIKSSAPARIVNVASIGQQTIDFDDVMLTRHYSGSRAYCQSKLAQIRVHGRPGGRTLSLGRDRQRVAPGNLHEHHHGASVRRHADQHRRAGSRGDLEGSPFRRRWTARPVCFSMVSARREPTLRHMTPTRGRASRRSVGNSADCRRTNRTVERARSPARPGSLSIPARTAITSSCCCCGPAPTSSCCCRI